MTETIDELSSGLNEYITHLGLNPNEVTVFRDSPDGYQLRPIGSPPSEWSWEPWPENADTEMIYSTLGEINRKIYDDYYSYE